MAYAFKKISKHICFTDYTKMFSIVAPLLENQNECVSLPFCTEDGLVSFLEDYEIGYIAVNDSIRFYKTNG